MMNLFSENMKCLQQSASDPTFLSKKTNAFQGSLFPARSGLPTLYLKDPMGQQYFLHSPQDPEGESAALLGDRRFHNGDVTILFGFGLGYLVDEVRKRMPSHHDLFVLEQIPEFLLIAMEHRDLRELFKDKRIRICLGVDSFRFIEQLKPIMGKAITGTINKLVYTPATRLAPSIYENIEKDVDAYVAEIKNGIKSFRGQIPVRIANLFKNIPVMIESAPAAGLRDTYTQRPAIVVAAGPSLDNNVEKIKQAKNKAIIIAVDAALKPLLSAGVVPDIVTTVETHGDNQKKFEGLAARDLKDVTLVFDPECTPCAPLNFPGARFFTNTQNSFSNWMVGLFGGTRDFPMMYTVSHLAFHLARYLGCDPIILAGFDLSFPGDKHHSSGSALTWAPDFQEGEFIEIEDIYGNKVKTLDQFLFMLRLLEREINKTRALCIDATEGGAFIRGTKIMSMNDALNEHLPEETDNFQSRLWDRYSSGMLQDTTTIERGMDWLVSEMKFCDGIIQQAKTLMQEPMPAVHENRNMNSASRDNPSPLRGLRDDILGRTEFFDVLGDLLTDLLIAETRYRSTGVDEETALNGNIQDGIKRYEYFFGEMEKAIEILKQHCTDFPHATLQDSL